MYKQDDKRPGVPASKLATRARLEALLFTGAALGTALLTVVAGEPKLPPFKSE